MNPNLMGNLARIGWSLYGLSMVTPNTELTSVGAFMAPAAFSYGFAFLIGARSLAAVLIGSALILGVLSNFTLFIRLPRWLLILSITAPWAPFIAFVQFQRKSHVDWKEILLAFPFFYLWALGIALIQGVRLAERRGGRPGIQRIDTT